MQLSTKQAQTLSRLRSDLPFYAKNCLKIANKQQAGALTPFVFNRAQWLLHEKLEAQRKSTGMVRAILLKGRQMGSSTYTQARFFHNLQFNPNRKAFILAHAADSTEHIFSMASTFKANLPEPMKPDMLVDNQREMTFKNGSSYAVGTAGRATVGRGRTVQYFHSSETAFYDKATDITTGMFQAVARAPGTEFIIESTANGPGNFFYNMYHQSLEGNGDFQAIFIPWYWQDEYTARLRPDFELTEEEMSLLRLFQKDGLTKEHLQWRRLKLAEMEGETWRFMQEYPCVCGDSSVVTTAGVKALREIVVGDVLPQGRVLKTMNKGVKACVKITTEDGHQLVCTPEHEVLTDEGFVPAQESLGKRIVLTPGVETPAESYRDEHRKFSSRVVSVEDVGDREVFDLEVEGTHTFNASGLVVHNCTAEEAWKRVEEAFYGMQRVYLAVDRYATLLDQHVAHLPRILGVDPGRTGDPTVCCDRWGRKVMGFTQWPYQGETHDMVSAGKIARMIQTHDYDAVNIDVGYGTGIIDRLREMGYRGIVHGVTFGSGAIRNDVYRNKRAEMAAESRDWFDEDVAIPDDKIFLAELSALPKEKETSNNLQFIVSKDILREGLKRSTNHMDAFWCTFAFPVKRRPRTVSVHSGITVTNITGQRAQSPKTGLRTLQGVRRGVV